MYICRKNIEIMNEVTLKLKSDEVRKIRQQKGLSQEYLATEVGLSQPQYSRIENGDSTVSSEKVIEISNVLGVLPSDIVAPPDSFVFNNCQQLQAGNNNTMNNNDLEKYFKQIEDLKTQIEGLKTLNTELLKIIQNFKPA